MKQLEYYHYGYLTYERASSFKYAPKEILMWLHKYCSVKIEVTRFNSSDVFYTFLIPDVTVAGVSVCHNKFNVPNLFGYKFTLRWPFTIADLQLFKSIIDFFEVQFSEHPNQFNNTKDWSDSVLNKKILNILSGTNITTVWEKMNVSFAEEKLKEKDNYFRASNGIVTFYLTPHWLSIPFDKASLTQQLIPALLKYIWQPSFIDVINCYYYIDVEKSGRIIKECAFEAIIWDNKNAQVISLYNYLVFQVNGKWLGVKLKIWLPVLYSYLKQYDATIRNKILPILDETLFNEFKTQFANQATNLLFDFTEANGKIKWVASIIE